MGKMKIYIMKQIHTNKKLLTVSKTKMIFCKKNRYHVIDNP